MALIAALVLSAFSSTAFAADDGNPVATEGHAVSSETDPTAGEPAAEPAGTSEPTPAATEPAHSATDKSAEVDSVNSASEPSPNAPSEGTEDAHESDETGVHGDVQPGPNEPANSAPADPGHASPADNGHSCTPVTDFRLSIGSSSATGTFSIGDGCGGIRVTVASYTIVSSGGQFPQTLFASSTGVFASGGPYSLTVALPACALQVDIILGSAPATLAGPSFAGGRVLTGEIRRAETPCGAPTQSPPPHVSPPDVTPPPAVTTPPSVTVTPPITPPVTAPVTPPTPVTPSGSTPPITTPPTAAAPTEVAGAEHEAAVGAVAEVASAELPFTGLPMWIALLIGISLFVVGTSLRRIGRGST